MRCVSDMALPAPSGPLRRLWGVVVLDEAQRIRNARHAGRRRGKSLPRQRGWALTGTPLENRPEDAVSILDFVAPGPARPGEMVAGLRRLLAQVQLRRRRAEVLPDLPPKTAFELACDLGPRQRTAYDAGRAAGAGVAASLGATVRITHVLELILRLKQLCNICPRSGASAKLEDLLPRRLGVVAPSEKALVFSQFVAEPFGAAMLARAAGAAAPGAADRRHDAAARDAAVAAFTRDPAHRVLVLVAARRRDRAEPDRGRRWCSISIAGGTRRWRRRRRIARTGSARRGRCRCSPT